MFLENALRKYDQSPIPDHHMALLHTWAPFLGRGKPGEFRYLSHTPLRNIRANRTKVPSLRTKSSGLPSQESAKCSQNEHIFFSNQPHIEDKTEHWRLFIVYAQLRTLLAHGAVRLTICYNSLMCVRKLLLCVWLVAVPVHADAPLDSLMQKLQQKYANLNTMKASFTQSYQSKRFSEKLQEGGMVYFKKGGLMKWDYTTPEKKLFVSDGFFYYYYVVQDKQVVKTPVDQKGDQHSPALFLAGRGDFLKDFHATWSDPRPGSHLVRLTPVDPQPDFKYLIVDVDPFSGIVLRLLVVDEYENRTEYTFQQIEENPSLAPNFFSFDPPSGTDVIFQRSGEN
jgi:outer membrane lipoprotein carrier protein